MCHIWHSNREEVRKHMIKRTISGMIGAGSLAHNRRDFVAKNSRGTIYYQVALTTHDESTLQKELRPLQVIRDHYPKIILTMDEEPEEQYDGIRRINARDWLLGLTE